MNYYQLHIGDWVLHTSHLSLEEEAVYSRLLGHYYDTESPIPKITQPVIRRLRLSDYSEIVDLILNEFFDLREDGWHNSRADKEISAYHDKANTARANGRNGGRPSKYVENNPEITQSVILANPEITGSKANQEPRTINQEPVINLLVGIPTAPADAVPNCPHGKIIEMYNSIVSDNGLPVSVNPSLWTGSTRAASLQSRWKESPKRQKAEWWQGLFEYIAKSDFLMGRTDKPFKADLGWILKRANFDKILEGKYHV